MSDSYEVALNRWARRLAADRGIATTEADEFRIDGSVGMGCETCGPEASLDLERISPSYKLIAEFHFGQIGDILRGIWETE